MLARECGTALETEENIVDVWGERTVRTTAGFRAV